MGHLRIRHLARTNRNALGGKGFGGNIFVAHGGKIFAISVFSLTSSFPVFFFFFSEPWKIRRPLQLSLTPTLTLHTWISFHLFGGRQRSPLGLYHSLHNHLRHPDDRRPGKKGGVSYHSLHNHLRHPDDRRPGKKGGVSMQIMPLASHWYYGASQRQAVDVFPRGDSEV